MLNNNLKSHVFIEKSLHFKGGKNRKSGINLEEKTYQNSYFYNNNKITS